jgi:glycosyltransferase involved in cell wall biosynthesis
MARLRLGLDLRLYGAPHAGLGRYAEELLSALVRFGDDLEIVTFTRGDQATRAYLSGLGLEVIESPYRPYTWQEQWYLPRQLQRAHLDLVHFPHFNVPLRYRGAYVVTIHDLIMHHFPWRVASQRSASIFWAKYGIYRQAMRVVAARARAVIAVSHYTAEDLLTYYPRLRERLRIIPEPTPAFAAAPNDDKEKALAYNIRSPYILVVGSFYPHKNLRLLLRAWPRVYAVTKRQLVLAGRFDAFAERLMGEAKARALLSDAADSPVRFLGFVSDQDLIRLYQGADFYLNPSLLEGAGLPGLEAIALAECRGFDNG